MYNTQLRTAAGFSALKLIRGTPEDRTVGGRTVIITVAVSKNNDNENELKRAILSLLYYMLYTIIYVYVYIYRRSIKHYYKSRLYNIAYYRRLMLRATVIELNIYIASAPYKMRWIQI